MYWVEIENTSGVRLGRLDVLSWESTDELSRAGRASFVCFGANRPTWLAVGNTAHCYTVVRGTVEEVGAFVIEKLDYRLGEAGPTVKAAGFDLLRELGTRSLQNLRVGVPTVARYFQHCFFYAKATQTFTALPDLVAAAPGANTAIANWTTDDYLYLIGDFYPTQAAVDVITANTNTATLSAEYHGANGWTPMGGWTDGTASGGKTLAVDGTLNWWDMVREFRGVTINEVSGYAIRLKTSATLSAGLVLRSIWPLAYGPNNTDDISNIVTYKSYAGLTTWACEVGAGRYNATTDGTVDQYVYESPLWALSQIARKTGERFRRGAGRTVAWLRDDAVWSGVHAVMGPDVWSVGASTTQCNILSLEMSCDAGKRVTRVYPMGRVLASGRPQDVRLATVSLLGYTLNAAGRYVEVTGAGAGGIPVLEAVVNFNEIGGDVETADAANELALAAMSYLGDYGVVAIDTLQLTLANVPTRLRPGDTLRVTALQSNGAEMVMSINGLYVIYSVATKIAGGVETVEVEVGTGLRPPATGSDRLVRALTMTGAGL